MILKSTWNRQSSLERVILSVRWIVILSLITGICVYAVPTWNLTLIGLLLAIGITYNLAVTILLKRNVIVPHLASISATVHGFLTVTGLLATGGAQSPFQPILVIILLAYATRFDPPLALRAILALLAAFGAGNLVLHQSALPDLTICILYNLLISLMVMGLVNENARQRMQMLAITAHEFRNPMTIIKGNCSLLKLMGVEDEILVRKRIDTIEKEINRLSQLLDEVQQAFVSMTDLSLDKRLHNLRDIVFAASQPFTGIDPKYRISLNITSESLPVMADAKRLEDVVRNLISNAVKFSPNGGLIDIGLSIDGKDALLTVSDEGVGIPKDKLAKVFDDYYRIGNLNEDDPGGMGLGLSIARNIVAAHGGIIWLDSKAGSGTTAFVRLPLSI